MKKNILLSLVMMLMTTVGALAQKEYNMVITLNNGTTVTLGHNDIKEITFNDGKVAITGNMVNTIDSLAGVTTGLNNMIITMATAVDDKFNQYANFVAAQNDVNKSLADFVQAQDECNQYFDYVINAILAAMEELHPEYAGAPEISKAKAALANARKAAAARKANSQK